MARCLASLARVDMVDAANAQSQMKVFLRTGRLCETLTDETIDRVADGLEDGRFESGLVPVFLIARRTSEDRNQFPICLRRV